MSPAKPEAAVNKWAITISVMLATVMNSLDTTIANVALPHIRAAFPRRRTRSPGC